MRSPQANANALESVTSPPTQPRRGAAHISIEGALDQELIASLHRWMLMAPFATIATVGVFWSADALGTGLVLAGIVLFGASLHVLAVNTQWFIGHWSFLPAYLSFAVSFGVLPFLALPQSQNGQVLLMLFGAVSLLMAGTALSARRRLAIWWVITGGTLMTVGWLVVDTQLDSYFPAIAFATLTILATAGLDESSARHRRLVDYAIAALDASQVDSLTGLYRRQPFLEQIELSMQVNGLGSLFFIDINRFKVINDTLGHKAGDQLLVATAERVGSVLSDGDLAGRIGGDEIAVFAPNLSRSDAPELADRLVALFADEFRLLGRRVGISVSIGVATSTEEGMAVADLIHFGDVAMYAAKRDGRSVRFFDEEMRANLLHLEETELALRTSLRQRRVVAYAQPIVDLSRGRIVAFEALGRWNRDGTIVTASDFYGSAQQGGLLPDITRAVATDVIDLTTSLDVAQRPLVAINVEAGDLGSFLEWTTANAVDPRLWILEITEGQILENFAEAAQHLHIASDMGFMVVLDDFGTGYSSLSRILELPIDGLKVDVSFVQAMLTDERARAIVSSIAHLASACDLLVSAEGVETQEQVEALREVGIELMQGFYFGHPEPLANALETHDKLIPAVAQLGQRAEGQAARERGPQRLAGMALDRRLRVPRLRSH